MSRSPCPKARADFQSDLVPDQFTLQDGGRWRSRTPGPKAPTAFKAAPGPAEFTFRSRGETTSFARRVPSREGLGTLRGFPSSLPLQRIVDESNAHSRIWSSASYH